MRLRQVRPHPFLWVPPILAMAFVACGTNPPGIPDPPERRISDSPPAKQVEPSSGVDVHVGWGQILREVPKNAYGVNSPANFIPGYSTDPVFMENLDQITAKRGLIRLHGWGMLGESPEAWQNGGVWNSSKIEQALRPLISEGYTVMINIPSGPDGEDDYHDPIAFAQFCASLVEIVNVDLSLGVRYWEIPNEREAGFAEPGLSIGEMAHLMETARDAMQSVDPTILVGGPATAWIHVDYVAELVSELYPNIDFVTLHTYSGDGMNDLGQAYDIAQDAMADLAELRSRIDATTESHLPIFVTEYNISYEGSPRIQTHEGAVYNAILLTQSIVAGADGSMYWNVAPYTDMSLLDGDTPYPNAYLYQAFNRDFYGSLVASESADATKVVVYAVSDTVAGRRSFALINRSSMPQPVVLRFDNWVPSDLAWQRWDADNNLSTVPISWKELGYGKFSVKPYSVNLFMSR